MTEGTAASQKTIRIIAAVLLAGLTVVLVLALISYRHEQIGGHGAIDGNYCGTAGAHLAALLIDGWGAAAFLIPVLLLVFIIGLLRHDTANTWLRLAGAALLLPTVAALLHLLPAASLSAVLQRWDHVNLQGIGGSTGWYLAAPDATHGGGLLRGALATAGTLVVLFCVAIGCLALLQLPVTALISGVRERMPTPRAKDGSGSGSSSGSRPRPALPTPEPADSTTDAVAKPPSHRVRKDPRDTIAETPVRNKTATSISAVSERIGRDSTTSLDADDLVARIRARRKALEDGADDDDEAFDEAVSRPAPPPTMAEDPRGDTLAGIEPTAANPATAALERSATPLPPVEQAPAGPVIASGMPTKKREPVKRTPQRKGDYALPSVELLEDAPDSDDDAHQAETLETSAEIEELFREFTINVKVVAATRGPTITMYELELQDAGMRVNKVAGFEKELALKLGTDGIRIVAPLPNKKTIGIEIPNRLKTPVVMRDLVDDIDPDTMALPVIIGRDVIGQPMVGDLAKMPHLLIAGATGTGKSVCLNAIIASILLYKSPTETRFIMVDPKMVELAGYDGIPHLMSPPITEMSKAHAALEWTCKTMDERFYALRMTGCRDIHAFNKLGPEGVAKKLAAKGKNAEDIPGFPEHMPFLVVVVDEYADLMMVNKDVEKSLVRLTAKARACGIHVILATQRPSADVVTGLIKSNLPTRICCRVADKSNSRVVLDSGGAENLLGRGDMLYLAPGTSNLVRGQGVWVRDHELDAVIDHARAQGEPEYDDSITSPSAISGGGGSGDGDSGDEWKADYQFHQAVWQMFKSGRTGADFLRRRLQVGYNKATKYIEWLEDLGFLSEAKGSRPREFLKSWDDWLDELKANDISYDPLDEAYTNPFD